MKLRAELQFGDINLENAFYDLKEGDALVKGLYSSLVKAFKRIGQNTFCGTQISKKLIPREYSQKYRVSNLWKYNLPGAWRLLYSVEKGEITVLAVILEWLNHKSYEKRFGY